MRLARRTALAGLGLAPFTLRGARAQAAGEFKIGGIGSFTGPGVPNTRDFFDGFTAYITDWNRRGGPDGRKVLIQSYDEESTPVGAVSAYRRLIEVPDLRVIWSSMTSSSGLAIKPLSTQPGIPIITPGGVDALGVPAAPFFFKTPPSSRDWIRTLLEWVKAHGIISIAAIQASDAYGQAITTAVKELAPSYNVRVVASEVFATSDTNFTAQLITVRNAQPGLVYMGGLGAPGILYKQLRLSMQVLVDQIVIN